jgi:hypothetical protein
MSASKKGERRAWMVRGKAACTGSHDRNRKTIAKVASKVDRGASAVGIAEVPLQRDKGYTRDGGHREGSQWDSPS